MRNLSVDERLGLPVVLAIALWVLLQFAFPASFWFDVGQVDVHDAENSATAPVDYPRVIERDFDAIWFVKIRRRTDDGWETVCVSPERREPYSTDSVLPAGGPDLEWFVWTEPRCYTLPPGEYDIRAEWTINPGSWLWERGVVREDTFIIWEAST